MHASVTAHSLRRLVFKVRVIFMTTALGRMKVSREAVLRRLKHLDGTWFEVLIEDDILTIK